MHKIFKTALLILFLPVLLAAQRTTSQKYAVLLGINDYYIQPGVKHAGSLHGCVNDALAIRGLLVERFGFKAENIFSLYNQDVTRLNVLDLMHRVAEKCGEGDSFVFFYSGHGAWMTNAANNGDPVKRGMSQAMVMSNLYAPYLECLLTDEMIKKALNEFVDKQVKVTSLFDCCFSGNISMGYDATFWMPLLRPETKSLMLHGVDYYPEIIQPVGCKADSLGHFADPKDSDHDGIPDCMDWEIHSPLPFVDERGVFMQKIAADDFADEIDKYMSRYSTLIDSLQQVDRAFNMKDALKVWYLRTERRPSERKNSNFISISAATDSQPGAEITDETGTRHGALTKALLAIYREETADIPLSRLLDRLSTLIKDQGYDQTPTYHVDSARLKENLVAANPLEFADAISATCSRVKAGVVSMNKGLWAGIEPGNILKDASLPGNVLVRVDFSFGDSALASDKTGLVKVGDKLQLVDKSTASLPIIKLFVPTIQCTPQEFQKFFSTTIKPWVDQKNYSDFIYNADGANDHITIFSGGKKYVNFYRQSLSSGLVDTNHYVFLPIPSYLVNELKSIAFQNQNVSFVSSADKADFILYMNYIKTRPGRGAGFVFYYHPRIDDPDNKWVGLFSHEVLLLPTLDLSKKEISEQAKVLYDLSVKTIRYKSSNWINNYPRRK